MSAPALGNPHPAPGMGGPHPSSLDDLARHVSSLSAQVSYVHSLIAHPSASSWDRERDPPCTHWTRDQVLSITQCLQGELDRDSVPLARRPERIRLIQDLCAFAFSSGFDFPSYYSRTRHQFDLSARITKHLGLPSSHFAEYTHTVQEVSKLPGMPS